MRKTFIYFAISAMLVIYADYPALIVRLADRNLASCCLDEAPSNF